MASSEVAVVTGLTPSPVPLVQGRVYRVGRSDRTWLRRHGDADHLALSRRTPPTVPVVALLLVPGREFVEVRFATRVSPVDVDGVPLGSTPVRLSDRHEVTVDPHGSAQRFQVLCRVRVEQPEPTVPSGTTIVPRLDIRGHRQRSVAVALAWPQIGDVPAPRVEGYSTGAVERRYTDLFGGPPPFETKRMLHELRRRLEEHRGDDGRPFRTIPELQPWPWDQDWRSTGFVNVSAFYEHANRVTAGHLANNEWVRAWLNDLLDRPR